MKGDMFGSFTYFTSLVSQKLPCQSLHNVNSEALCVTELRYKPGLPILILSIQLHFAFYLRAADKRHFCCSLKEHLFYLYKNVLFFFLPSEEQWEGRTSRCLVWVYCFAMI